jgi:hypothetical protein
MRYAGAERDRAHVDVAAIDVPVVVAFGVAAAGECGHAPLKRTADRPTNYQSLGDRNGEGLQRVVAVERLKATSALLYERPPVRFYPSPSPQF